MVHAVLLLGVLAVACFDAATARGWQWAISALKSAGLNSAQALAQAKDENERVTATIMGRYEERLTAFG